MSYIQIQTRPDRAFHKFNLSQAYEYLDCISDAFNDFLICLYKG